MALDTAVSSRLRVYWQPHCSSCAFVKQFLTRNGVDYESINVLEHKNAYDDMRAIGARSVPIVARGDKFVYAQSIADVAAFVGLAPTSFGLAPAVLIERGETILAASERYVRQLPEALLATEMPNRPNRTYRILAHHAFNVVETFLEALGGDVLTYETLVRPPPGEMHSSAQIADYGHDIRGRFLTWWRASADRNGVAPMNTYYGEKPMREVLLRTVSHAGQHSRQLAALLHMNGIAPNQALPDSVYDGLLVAEDALDR